MASRLQRAAFTSSRTPALGLAVPRFTRQLYTNPDFEVKTPDDALGLLRQGNERFVQGQILAPHRGLGRLKDTAGVQKPFAAFLSCADSRVPVEIIFDQGFGDVFIVRVAGNVASTAVIASLEFGCAVLGCKLLYVLGHTSCGAVKATMNPQAVPGVISSLYYHIRPAVENAKGDQDKAIEENVRIQCKSLGISPVITSLQEEGKLKVVGGIYDLATGKVREIDC